MSAILFALLLGSATVFGIGPSQSADDEPSRLVFENGSPGQFTFEHGVMRLSAGRGLLRTRRPFSDFALTLEVLSDTPDTVAALGIRSWPGDKGWPRRGYALSLTGPASGELQGRGARVNRLEAGGPFVPSTGWQAVSVTATGPKVTVEWNGVPAGAFQVDETVGLIVFTVDRGTLQLRNVRIRELPLSTVSGQGVYTYSELAARSGAETPRPIKEVRPKYPDGTMRRRVEGPVELEVVILEDGTVGPLRVVKSLDPDLDRAAIVALRRWRFAPGKVNGTPVPVSLTLEMTFRLRGI